MSFGYCYDPYDSGWGGKAQPGLVALRNVTIQRVPPVGDLGILRDKSRCNKASAHCHGRAWDAAIGPDPTEVPIGTKLAEFFVRPEVAQMLGVQRVIWGFGTGRAKEWDSRPGQRLWSAYSGPAHDEHVHVELCWEAARRLTAQQVRDAYDRYWPDQEDEMKPEDWQRLEAFVHKEVGMLAAALLEKDNEKAQAGGSHFDTPRGESVMDVAVSARNHARKAAENTATPPAPPAPPVDAGDSDPVNPEDPDNG